MHYIWCPSISSPSYSLFLTHQSIHSDCSYPFGCHCYLPAKFDHSRSPSPSDKSRTPPNSRHHSSPPESLQKHCFVHLSLTRRRRAKCLTPPKEALLRPHSTRETTVGQPGRPRLHPVNGDWVPIMRRCTLSRVGEWEIHDNRVVAPTKSRSAQPSNSKNRYSKFVTLGGWVWLYYNLLFIFVPFSNVSSRTFWWILNISLVPSCEQSNLLVNFKMLFLSPCVPSAESSSHPLFLLSLPRAKCRLGL